VLYAAAFALMLAAGAALVAASLGSLQSTRVLWVSAGLSYASILFALLAVVVPGGSG
jgi:hypothetical protein